MRKIKSAPEGRQEEAARHLNRVSAYSRSEDTDGIEFSFALSGCGQKQQGRGKHGRLVRLATQQPEASSDRPLELYPGKSEAARVYHTN